MNLVPRAGIEPARPFSRQILSLLCLPIPPPGLGYNRMVLVLLDLFQTLQYINHLGHSY